MTRGPIIIVEDDIDDQEIYKKAINSLEVQNPILTFCGCESALAYLQTTEDEPFIIISDVNLPKVNGIWFREIMQQDKNLKAKGTPFIFISTDASEITIQKAHSLNIQGFFQKPHRYPQIVKMFRTILDYWEMCKFSPNLY